MGYRGAIGLHGDYEAHLAFMKRPAGDQRPRAGVVRNNGERAAPGNGQMGLARSEPRCCGPVL
jgi:hypothetical protein